MIPMETHREVLCLFLLKLLLVSSQEVTEPQSDVTILRQINRLNDDGSYTFGYEAADGSFKIETRDVEGNVKGMFGFVDENGELKRISYSAKNGTGFQASGTIAPPVDIKTKLNPSYTTVRPSTKHPFLRRPILILKAMTPEEKEEENEEDQDDSRRPYYSEDYRRRTQQQQHGDYLRDNDRHVPYFDSNELTSGRPVVAKKILIAKRLSEDINEKRPRGGSGLRRQLHRGSDTADTRGTGSGTFLTGQSPSVPARLAVLASLMNEFEASSRSYSNEYASSPQETQYAKVSYSEPDYVDYSDGSTPVPSPLPKQFYPITTPIPDPTPGYQRRPLPTNIPYRNSVYGNIPREPYAAAYSALREELMEYILNFLQQRLLNGQFGGPLGLPQQYPGGPQQYPGVGPQYPGQTIAPPVSPIPYGYDTPYNSLRSYGPSPSYPPQSFLPGRYPLSPVPYLNTGRHYPQQPLPLVTPNIQYSEPALKYPSMEDFTSTQAPKIFSSRRLTPRRKFRPSPQVEESYDYTTQPQDLGQNLVTSPTRSSPVRYTVTSSTTEASRSKAPQPVRNVQIIESESRVSPSVTPKTSKQSSESSSSSSR